MQVNQVLPGESEKGFKLLKRIIKIFFFNVFYKHCSS